MQRATENLNSGSITNVVGTENQPSIGTRILNGMYDAGHYVAQGAAKVGRYVVIGLALAGGTAIVGNSIACNEDGRGCELKASDRQSWSDASGHGHNGAGGPGAGYGHHRHH